MRWLRSPLRPPAARVIPVTNVLRWIQQWPAEAHRQPFRITCLSTLSHRSRALSALENATPRSYRPRKISRTCREARSCHAPLNCDRFYCQASRKKIRKMKSREIGLAGGRNLEISLCSVIPCIMTNHIYVLIVFEERRGVVMQNELYENRD